MKREESIHLFRKAGLGIFAEDILNQIYDEHESELQALQARIAELEQTRTCEADCKYAIIDTIEDRHCAKPDCIRFTPARDHYTTKAQQ